MGVPCREPSVRKSPKTSSYKVLFLSNAFKIMRSIPRPKFRFNEVKNKSINFQVGGVRNLGIYRKGKPMDKPAKKCRAVGLVTSISGWGGGGLGDSQPTALR